MSDSADSHLGDPPRLVDRFGVLKVVVGSGGGRAAGLVGALVAAWLLGPAQFGVLGFAQATAVMISSFGGLAMPAIVTREVAQQSADNTLITRSGLRVAWTTTMLVALVLLAVAALGVGITLPEEARGSVPLLMAAVVVSAAAQSTNGILLGRLLGIGELATWSTFTAARAIAVGVGSASAALTGSGTWAMVGAALGEAAVGTVYYVRLRRQSQGDAPSSYRRGWNLLKLSAAPAVAEQGYQGAYWLGQLWLVAQPNGLVLVGWYTLANRLVQGASFLPLSFVNSYASALHRAATAHAHVRATFLKTARLTTMAAIAATVALIVAAAVLGMVSDEYAGAAPTIQVLALCLVFIGWNSLVGDLALATHQIVGWALSDVVLAGVFILAAWLLIPGYGPVGLAVAGVVSYSASVVFLLGYLWWRGNNAPRTV
jgi:O-antigen/teichoic acid export membrane protein